LIQKKKGHQRTAWCPLLFCDLDASGIVDRSRHGGGISEAFNYVHWHFFRILRNLETNADASRELNGRILAKSFFFIPLLVSE
jgi:hypothetical protein